MMKPLLLCFFVLAMKTVNCLLLPEAISGPVSKQSPLSWLSRERRLTRIAHRVIDPIEECFLVTSEEEELFYKSPSDDSLVCGIYMITDPDKRIEVTFNYLDVPCNKNGLVAWIDGWELRGEVWPADDWDESRVVETCDQRPKTKLVSRQNAALVQYRVPVKGKGFAITIRHVPNIKPCNIMMFGSEGVVTLRNHKIPGNCSVLAVSPAVVQILDLNVGQSVKRNNIMTIETGTIHQCTKRGIPDRVDVGGSSGLDHTAMEILDSVCGVNSKGARYPAYIACESTVVRLVSSGRYYNSVKVSFKPLATEDIAASDLICAINDV